METAEAFEKRPLRSKSLPARLRAPNCASRTKERLGSEPHKFFTLEGNDVFADVLVPFTTMALGGEIEIPFIEGTETLKIPHGTQSGHVFTFKNRGIPRLNGFGRGNHQIKVVVEVPTKLSKKQEQLLKDFDEGSSEKKKKGWFG